ncbi:hypothetical protein LTR41_003416 [Exophiala xenobiotica]|nr:hypothetical protein LTR41_003416 [Exophiala xenobiotica]
MESGLKKLWTRRKSKGRDAMRDSGVSSLRKSQSTDQAGWSVNGSPRSNHARSTSNEQSGRLLSPTTTTSSSLRPGSSNRRQPMLVGVSRPSTSLSRPGTSGSGSLMTAVNRAAADAVARAEQEYQQSAEHYAKTNRRQKAPRYIDIFSLSNADGSNPMPGYNEDVAERNLDLARVALGGTHEPIVPSSKYAEEVATRNAYPPLGESSSTNTSLSSPRRRFEDGVQSSLSRDIPSRVSDHPSVSVRSDNPERSRYQPTPKSFDVHPAQSSERPWQPQQQLHELPTEGQESSGVLPSHHLHHVRPATEGIREGMTASRSPGIYGHLDQNDVLRSYQLSTTELVQANPNDRPQYSRPGTAMSVAGANAPRRADYMRSPSSLSTTSSVVKRAINLPRRTIMDLTGTDSDVFSEMASESAYTSSPVVEQAKIDTVQRIPGKPSEHPIFKPDAAELRTKAARPAAVSSSLAEVAPSKAHQGPVSESLVSRTPTQPTKTSAFSPVSTVASLPPRASVLIQSKDGFDALEHMMVKPFMRESTPPAETSQQQTRDQLESPTDDDHATVEKEKDIEHGHVSVQGSASAVELPAVADINGGKKEDIDSRQNFPHAGPSPQPQVEEPVQPQQYIHMIAENVRPADFVDSSRSFGVHTRDFASPPPKSALKSVPEDHELAGDRRSKHVRYLRNRSASHDPSTGRTSVKSPDLPRIAIYQSTFNEAEFAHKQAEARAALIRLQESLNENFLTQTPPSRSSRPNAPKHAFSYSDGKPVAPSTIFAQVRNSPPVPAGPKFAADMSTDVVRTETPTSSYHNLTTVPEAADRENPRRRDMNGMLQERQERTKGKQKQQSQHLELSGPGPSIVDGEDDLHNNPLPLPPPLHINGRRFQQQQQQPVPPSPGEVSLSSFPLPVSSPRQSQSSRGGRPSSAEPMSIKGSSPSPAAQQQHMSQHSHQSSSGGASRVLRRPSSQRSQASSASVFSIPYHMIPDRSSSIRDRLVMEESE